MSPVHGSSGLCREGWTPERRGRAGHKQGEMEPLTHAPEQAHGFGGRPLPNSYSFISLEQL